MHASSGESSGVHVRAVFCCALAPEAAAAQPATHALLDARGDGGDVGARGRGAFAKHDGAGVVRAEDPIGHDDVEVHKTPERRIETLHERDGARLAPRARNTLLPARDFLHEDAPLRRQRVRSEREHAPNFVRRRQHPLPHRDVRQHVRHQVRGSVAHPPGRARRARSTAFARVRDDDFLAALRAHNAQKSVRQDAATQVPPKLFFHVPRQRFAALFAHGGKEGFEVLAHDAMEHGVLRFAARVASRRRGRRRWRGKGRGSPRGGAFARDGPLTRRRDWCGRRVRRGGAAMTEGGGPPPRLCPHRCA